MRQVMWSLVQVPAGRRLLRAVAGNTMVRRSLWSAAGRRRGLLLMLDDPRIRNAAFDALEHGKVLAAVTVAVDNHAPRSGQPIWIRQISHVLRDADLRAALRRALDRPEVLRDITQAARDDGGI